MNFPEEMRPGDFEPSDKDRLDWLGRKVRDGEIVLLAEDAPTALDLRFLIDAMMRRDIGAEASSAKPAKRGEHER